MTRIAIHVDDRERASAVFALLGKAPEVEVTVTRLKLGDWLICHFAAEVIATEYEF